MAGASGVVEQAHLADFATTAAADVTAPVVKAPAVRIAKGATIGTAKVPLSLALTASDPGSGVCRLQVEAPLLRRNPYAPVPLLLATSRSASASVSPAARAYTLRGGGDGLLRQHLGVRHGGARCG